MDQDQFSPARPATGRILPFAGRQRQPQHHATEQTMSRRLIAEITRDLRALRRETGGCAPKVDPIALGVEHVKAANRQLVQLPDREVNESGHRRGVAETHAHLLAAVSFFDDHFDAPAAGAKAYGAADMLDKCRAAVAAACEECDAIPERDGEEREACIRQAAGYTRGAERHCSAYRDTLDSADDGGSPDGTNPDPEMRRIRSNARAIAAVTLAGFGAARD
jgi:hypothetical protein